MLELKSSGPQVIVEGEHFIDGSSDGERHLRLVGQATCILQLLQPLSIVFGVLPGAPAVYHLVEGHPQAPDIALEIERAVLEALGREELLSPSREGSSQFVLVPHVHGKPEVAQLGEA